MKIAKEIHYAHHNGAITETNRAAMAQLVIHADSIINVIQRIANSDTRQEPLTANEAQQLAANLLMTLNRY